MQYRLLAALLAAAAACSDRSPGQCTANDGCGAGQVCSAGSCETLCTPEASTCPSGLVCVESICRPAGTVPPVIDAVDGDDRALCQDTPDRHCLSTALVVSGQYLSTANFMLHQGGTSLPLMIRAEPSDTRVELVMPDIGPGTYLLVATNAAGSAQASLQLLQGPPGSPDTALQVLGKLVTVDGAGSGLDADFIDGIDAADLLGSLGSGGGMIEAESTATGTTQTGSSRADATASGSSVRIGEAAAGTGGRMWGYSSAESGALLGSSMSRVTLRLKVSSIASTAAIGRLVCTAQRATGSMPSSAGPAVDIVPSTFSAANVWMEISTVCDLRPDDAEQVIAVDAYATGVADLSIDWARVQPADSKPRATALMRGVAGPLPLTSSPFVSYGGPLLIFASGSGRRESSGGTVGMSVSIDGVNKGYVKGYANETASHKAFNPCLIVADVPAGTHTLTLDIWSLTVTDSNDFFYATVLELPH